MSGRASILITVALLLSLAAGVALYQLFALRFEAGDLFPAGSSLNSDPIGSMALFRAVGRTDGITAIRNYRPLERQSLANATVLLLGSSSRLLSDRTVATRLDRLAADGNRIVIAFAPTSAAPAAPTPSDKDADDDKACAENTPATAWGLTTALLAVGPQHPANRPVRGALAADIPGLPPTARFASRLTLHPVAGWRSVYVVDNRALILERTIGSGSLVVVSDSSIFSNEALKLDRQTELLTWLLGSNRTVIFDETHLGVTEQGGIMTLARRFGLTPLLGVGLLLAGLYIWRQSLALLPRLRPERDDRTVGVEHDSFNGLVNLLRRSIPADRLLATCCQEWRKSFSHELQHDSALRDELRDALQAGDDPLGRYRRIARIRAERNGR